MSDAPCPVNTAIDSLNRILSSKSLVSPQCQRIADEILTLMQDVAGGSAGSNHLLSIRMLAQKLVDTGQGDACNTAGTSITLALDQHYDIFASHVETHNCPSGECARLAPAPCQMTCPAGLDIPTYITLIGKGRYAEAIEVIRKDNPFPWVCGLICTRPCELSCVRGRIDKPVSIKFLKAFAAEQAMSDGLYKNPEKEANRGKKVCVIGSGPAGMSAAYYLALRGYGVCVVESLPAAGGMMRVGIPQYRLPREVIDREVAMLENLDVEFRYNTVFGKDVNLDMLKAEGFKAFFFAIGAHNSFRLNIPGENDYAQVIQSIDLLRRVALGDRKIPGMKVVVIGGGNVAIDAARTCLRLGCDKVILAYRRTRSEMPADTEEIEQAEEEGIHFSFLTIPSGIEGQQGRVTAIRCIRAELVSQEGSDRKYPVPIVGSDYFIETDAVISAIGQQVDMSCLSSLSGLKWTRKNTIDVNKVSMETSIPGIFAAGDAVSGPATVIEAVAAGKRAAYAIERYLSGLSQPSLPCLPVRRGRMGFIKVSAGEKMDLKRPHMPLLSINQRQTTFQQVELGFSANMVREETKRCLRCDVCLRCGRCVEICRDEMRIEALKMGYVSCDRPGATDFRITEERCILCGACAANCPTQAMKMEDYKEERILSLCGTILNRQKLTRCERCGSVMGVARYLEYIRNRTRSVIQFSEIRPICDVCARIQFASCTDDLFFKE